jgi:hypothetical protein
MMIGCLFALAAIQVFSLTAVQIVAALTILLGIVPGIGIIVRSEASSTRRISVAFLLFIIFRSISALYCQDHNAAIDALQYPFFALIFIILANWPRYLDKSSVSKLEAVWFWAAVIAAIIGIGKYATGIESRIGTPTGAQVVHADGTVEGNYATFAKFLLFTLLYFGISWIKDLRIKGSIWKVVGFGILLTGLILTFSRACWLAAAITIPVFTFKWKPKATLLGLTVIAVLLVAIPYGRIRVMQSLSPTNWSSGRIELWNVAFDKAVDKPVIGHGIGSFKSIVTQDIRESLPDKGVGDWHNQYIQIFMENGIVGLLLFTWLIIELFNGYSKTLTHFKDIRASNAAMGGCALLIGFLIVSLFDTTFNSPHANISFWSLAGLAVGWSRGVNREPVY